MTEARTPDLRVINLGAGVQSTTLILMAARGEFDVIPDCAIFADTQWEPKAVYEHLDWLEREVGHIIPIYRVTKGNIRQACLESKNGKRFAALPFHVRNPDGKSGMLRRQCTREYKIEPINRKIRELLGFKPRKRITKTVEQWFGISIDEAFRMRDSRYPWAINRYPLVEKDMTRWDCVLWLQRNGYPVPMKSACIGCPFHDDRYWRDMRDNRPEEWADAVDFDRQIRTGLRGVLHEAYLHRSLVPLDQVDLSTDRDYGQLDLFEMECEGMCGV